MGIPRILSLPEKLFILKDAGVSLLIAEKAFKTQFANMQDAYSAPLQIWDADPGDLESDWHIRTQDGAYQLPGIEIDPFAPAAIAYTSGTTGHPKGAVHSQHNLLLPGAVAVAVGEFGPEDNSGVVLPLRPIRISR